MKSYALLLLAALVMGGHLWFYVGMALGLVQRDWEQAIAFGVALLAVEYQPVSLRTRSTP